LSRASRRCAGSRATSRPTRSTAARRWAQPPSAPTASPTSASFVAETGAFERDTAVRRLTTGLPSAQEGEIAFAADVSPDWRAGRGPHGGYVAAIMLRALIEALDDAARAPRSLTVHYPRA